MKLNKANQYTGKTLNGKQKVTAVIPCLNDGKTLASLLRELKKVVDEIIVIDDGSSDNTPTIVKTSKSLLLTHKNNLGYDRSLNDGFKLAAKRGAAVIVTIDADGEHRVADVGRIIKPIINRRADVVIGARVKKRHLLQDCFGILAHFMYGITDPLSGLKAYRVDVYNAVGFFDRVNSIGVQLCVRAVKNGFVLIEVPIATKIRKDSSRFYERSLSGNSKVLRSMTLMICNKL